MISINFEEQEIDLRENESVLEGLIRAGHEVPNGCRAGVCQSCIMVSDERIDVSEAQQGLTEAQKDLNYFLSCQCRPSERFEVKRAKILEKRIRGRVVSKSMIGRNVISLRVKAPLEYRPGQYVTLWRGRNLARSYSLASHSYYSDFLEFHIKYVRGGEFSPWIWHELSVGDGIDIRGPLGTCIYSGDKEQPILMLALGTGLSPIYGILQDALVKGHKAPIDVLIAAKTARDFYLVNELKEIERRNKKVRIKFLSQEDETNFAQKGNIYDYTKEVFPSLDEHKVYICGAESFVRKLRKQCFLAGARLQNISSDIFLPAAK